MAYTIVRERVWMRATGLVLYARPRTGKTRCSVSVREALVAEFSDKKFTLISSDESSGKSAKNSKVIERIVAVERLFESRSHSYDPITLLLNHVVTQLSSMGGDHWTLLIDEMQMMDSAQFTRLLVLTNTLEAAGVTTTVVGFGQPEICNLGGLFKEMNKTNLTARFLAELVQFEGCTSVEYLAELLRQYDEVLEYPLGSGCTYTQFFIPLAFRTGVRLGDAAQELWAGMVRGGGGDVEMEPICRAVQVLLLEARRRDDTKFHFTSELIASAAARSGVAALRSL